MTDGSLRPAWATIDLDALGRNVRLLRQRTGAALLAVVKADAYGHGTTPVGRELEGLGVDWLGVALVEEGLDLRVAGVRCPILVLSPIASAQLGAVRDNDLTPAVSSMEQLAMWADWSRSSGAVQDFHLKVDTGMSRLGIEVAEFPGALARIRASDGLRLTGVLSHFAEGDEPDSPRNQRQEDRFEALVGMLGDDERASVQLHLANSAGALHRPSSRHDLVRCGLALYGYDPARRIGDLAPVMSVGARLVQERLVGEGRRAGYGGTWRASRPSRLGCVPVGYADGYPWRLSAEARVLVGGARLPLAGSVSMDMTLIDLTPSRAGLGDEVVLLGRQGEETIDAWDLAGWAGTIPYEILCDFGLRLPRSYRRGGVEVETGGRGGSAA